LAFLARSKKKLFLVLLHKILKKQPLDFTSEASAQNEKACASMQKVPKLPKNCP
jgi:hypothetical protein